LGAVLALAPLGGWLATSGNARGYPWALSIGVALWVAGFDIVYACQDEAVDRAQGLHSIPGRLGSVRALRVAGTLHAAAFLAFAEVAIAVNLGWPYAIGLTIVGAMLVLEHRAASAVDLGRIRFAFFTANALVSVTIFGSVVAAVLLR
jgi:4-hydroxybenzoate polyprenyltransferase